MSFNARLNRLERNIELRTADRRLTQERLTADCFAMDQTLPMPDELRQARDERRGEIVAALAANPSMTPQEALSL